MIAVTVSVTGIEAVRKVLALVSPAQSPAIIRDALRKSALRVAAVAAKDEIIRGGKQPPHPTRLTSRTGTGRRSIGVDFPHTDPEIATIGSQLRPSSVRIGSFLGYMALHETGGEVLVRGAIVRAHMRKSAFGKRRKPFQVPQHYRSAHSANFPARPWLAPAVTKVEREMPAIFLSTWKRIAGVR